MIVKYQIFPFSSIFSFALFSLVSHISSLLVINYHFSYQTCYETIAFVCLFVCCCFLWRMRGVACKRFDCIDFCLQHPCSVNYFVGIIIRVDRQIFPIETHGPFLCTYRQMIFIMVHGIVHFQSQDFLC